MSDNFSNNTNSIQNCSENDTEDDIKFDNDNYSSESFDTGNMEVTDFEKHLINHKQNLEKRLKDLQTIMFSLRKQLAEEKYLWKQQLDEVAQESHLYSGEYQMYEPVKTCDIIESCDPFNNGKSYSKEIATLEYEDKLVKYQDAILKAHAEKRANLRRQISINNYKRRLMEVENMCNLELLRVKQSVQFLQPLQMMVSEWNINNPKEIMIGDEEISGVHTTKEDGTNVSKTDEQLSINNVNANLYEANINFSKTQNLKLAKRTSTSTSTVWRVDEDSLKNSRSAIWSSTECLTL